MSDDDVKQTLIDACLILDQQGLGDMTRGHISVRVPGDPELFYMKPHSFGLDEVTLENIVTCNLAGERVAGTAPRHSEVFIHSEIFRLRPDVTSVIHVHPTHTVAFSATERILRPISQPAAAFADGLPVFADTMNLIRSPESGAAVARALGPHKAVVMRAHGAAIVGATIAEAVVMTLALENACQIQLLAEAAGPVDWEFPADDVQRLQSDTCKPRQHEINFAYLRRKARRQAGR